MQAFLIYLSQFLQSPSSLDSPFFKVFMPNYIKTRRNILVFATKTKLKIVFQEDIR